MNMLQDERAVRPNSGNRFFIWSVVLLLLTGADLLAVCEQRLAAMTRHC